MCGEKSIRRIMQSKVMGSPPRMRGKAVAIFRQLHHGRITPAYAGKRDSIPQQSSLRRDHPRVCGEKPRIFFMSIRSAGSPPRMRGKVSAEDFKPQTGGDHPRVCGEKPLQSSVNCTMEGLPPRMRGKVISSLQCDFLSGIIPACAGKSFWPCTVLPRCRDHPRVCGEKNKFQTHGGPVEGSPPRVRGKALVRPCWKLSTGITPACAGKSSR